MNSNWIAKSIKVKDKLSFYVKQIHKRKQSTKYNSGPIGTTLLRCSTDEYCKGHFKENNIKTV